METVIKVDEVSYTFVTIDGATVLKLESVTTASDDIVPHELGLPEAWVVTRSNGVPLFALRPSSCDKPFRILTAEKLYAEAIQWFEPLADKYKELIWINAKSRFEGSEVYSAYKHHTWQSIIDFAIVDRSSVMFYNHLPGDWKRQSDGGDGYLLTLVEGSPYWTDGIGQIPFAVDTFRMYWQEALEIDTAVRKTGVTGLNWADGSLGGSDKGSENVYDNFMIIRACLWASENFVLVPKGVNSVGEKSVPDAAPPMKTVFAASSNERLKMAVTADALAKYKTWKP
ncbi:MULTISPECIES: hypothetical protein [Pseudomonas]|uniref:Uncharacterized protein n=2 Tax=Pseudomonas fragariae (ex Marin et al. 2024) TaxID=3080056 RepID=A0ABT3LPS0_9PSED|nr:MULTISPECIES: hypothetical protein [Pseudomonas]MCW6057971.1 hypothetical protein [Pseudomonas fragi]MDV0428059.1 hypothetical protein [Pseudomonas sp. 17]MDX9574416.1 hypothetical protein [Pseudomonas sp. 21(2023)]MDX9588600.1 hypothetical protein [Pseudomonas sp. 19(2023)]MDX9625525.1 hypothetical protein [Pseudomonas sp. 20]